MCTAVSIWGKRHLFGRTLDLERTYGETVALAPRGFFAEDDGEARYAMLGVAHIFGGEPLYYDAVNERGLVAAALNFPGEAVYHKAGEKRGVPSYALISRVLSRAGTVAEVAALLEEITVTDDMVDASLPTTPLHWIFADKSGALTVESVKEGLMVYENPVGVLTNAPRFSEQMARMKGGERRDDFSSTARFLRAAFYKSRTVMGVNREAAAGDLFHLMETVSVPKGAVVTARGEMPYTQYTACVDAATGTYFFTTHDCRRIRAVTMRDKNLDGNTLYAAPLSRPEDVLYL